MDSQTGLDIDFLKKLGEEFDSNSKNLISQLALSRYSVSETLFSRECSQQTQHVFNTKVDKEGKPVTNQKASGRCWIFACLNAVRQPFVKKFGIEDFEFSQNYLYFWDKIERFNYYSDVLMECAKNGEKPDGRLMGHLLKQPMDDGGQWDMLINLVEKHGLVPKSCFPEAFNSDRSYFTNSLLHSKIRESCCIYTKLAAEGASDETFQSEKEKMMKEVFKIVSILLGTPPKEFVWEFEAKPDDKTKDETKTEETKDETKTEEKDSDKKEESKPDKVYRSIGPITPHDFYHQHVKDVYNMQDKVCLINDTRSENPFNKTYTVQYLNNMSNAKNVFYVNQPIDILKQYAMDSIKNGEAVWYGCEVGKSFIQKHGVNDLKCIDFNLVFDTNFREMSKADRLRFGESMMSHAMVLTGVHIENDKPTKWRVENSWGDDSCRKGYILMTDDWFTEFVYEVVIDKSYLPKEMLELLDVEPKVLPPWDPLGALAH